MEFKPFGYDLEWRPSKDYPSHAWFKLAQWFLSRRLKCKKSTTDAQGWQKSSLKFYSGELKLDEDQTSYIHIFICHQHLCVGLKNRFCLLKMLLKNYQVEIVIILCKKLSSSNRHIHIFNMPPNNYVLVWNQRLFLSFYI